ncbi:ArgS-related anticodon-binding protein NrtL [Streptomyces orinoci]|uniref:arginine--tRNA ligase n=1 Tax=Streptomyces orinoci TaxID=67339 RepID=A0ABV3JTA5_STRON|nr:arginine--tRNA ligase [Streptomyces orinoci]
MTPADLSRTVLHTVRCAVEADELRAAVPDGAGVRVPPRPGCGDYATNVALRLAKESGRPALEIAELLRRRLAGEPGIAGVEIAGPGFLNITLERPAHGRLVRELLARDERAEPFPLRPAEESVRRLGMDAARWSLVTPPGVDRRLLLVQREENPLFRVRYAHARCRALLRNAADLGFTPQVGDENGEFGPGSQELLAELGEHRRIAAAGDPGRLARHLERLAEGLLRWQARCPTLPRGDEKPSAVHRARLALAEATGKVLADGLTQLGITAPAHL